MRSPLRSLTGSENEIYLTFDDGPCPGVTEHVLNQLDNVEAKGTFFVIGEQAKKNKSLLKEVISRGHAIGNHSWDHRYGHYFRNKNHLQQWVVDSHHRLADLIGEEPVAFRSPAGVITPPLKQAMAELDIAWVHWSRRYFDTNVPLTWTSPWWQFKRGDIVLLHDRQSSFLKIHFLMTLVKMLGVLRDKGFDIQPLSKEKFHNDC